MAMVMLLREFICFYLLTSVSCFVSADTENDNQQFCVCVPYWQCKEDYSGLIEDGIDIMDVRKRYVITSIES